MYLFSRSRGGEIRYTASIIRYVFAGKKPTLVSFQVGPGAASSGLVGRYKESRWLTSSVRVPLCAPVAWQMLCKCEADYDICTALRGHGFVVFFFCARACVSVEVGNRYKEGGLASFWLGALGALIFHIQKLHFC